MPKKMQCAQNKAKGGDKFDDAGCYKRITPNGLCNVVQSTWPLISNILLQALRVFTLAKWEVFYSYGTIRNNLAPALTSFGALRFALSAPCNIILQVTPLFAL